MSVKTLLAALYLYTLLFLGEVVSESRSFFHDSQVLHAGDLQLVFTSFLLGLPNLQWK